MRLRQLAIVGLLVSMLGLGACGRASSPEPPPDFEKKGDEPFILDLPLDPPLPD